MDAGKLQTAIHRKAREQLRADMKRFQKAIQCAFHDLGVRNFYLWYLKPDESTNRSDPSEKLARKALEVAARNMDPAGELPSLLADREEKMVHEVLEAAQQIARLQADVEDLESRS